MTLLVELQHLSGSLAGQRQRIALAPEDAIRLGRDAQNDVVFSDQVDDAVSGVHAELRLEGGRVYIEDQRSTNGTYLNGAACPPFQRIAVADGSRLRLGRQGPEMHVTLHEQTLAGAAPQEGEQAVGGVSRATLEREVDQARQAEREMVSKEWMRSRRARRVWLSAAAGVFVLLGGASLAYFLWGGERAQASPTKGLASNPWTELEGAVAPALAQVRARYLLRVPQASADGDSRLVQIPGGEVLGSGILIQPGVLLTSRHLVEPWRHAFDRPWDEVADETGLSPEYDVLEVQFPGQQPIGATVLAVAEDLDLALLAIPQRSTSPVPLAEESAHATDEVVVIGYSFDTGGSLLFEPDATRLTGRAAKGVAAQPKFQRGTVTVPVSDQGELAGFFLLDLELHAGSGGSAVIDRDGRLVGISSQRIERGGETRVFGQLLQVMREGGGTARAISPEQIRRFLERTGLG